MGARSIQTSKFDKKIDNLVSAPFFTCFETNFSDTLLILYGLNFTSEANYGTKE